VFVGASHTTASATAHRNTARHLTVAKPVKPAGQVLGASTSTTAALDAPLVQPLSAPPAVLQDTPVSTSLLAAVLAAFENNVSAKLSSITKPPVFPEGVAAGGNGIFSYGAAAAASSGGGGSGGGVSASEVVAQGLRSFYFHLQQRCGSASSSQGCCLRI